MSYMWNFYSFSSLKFDAIAGSGDAGHEELIVDAVTWDDWGDMEAIERLAKAFVRSGPSYDTLSKDDASIMDGLIAMLFSPEGLEEELEIEPESPDGLHPSVVDEMIRRAEGQIELQLFPILNGGRRLGSDGPVHCEYFLLSCDEVGVLRSEVEQILALPGSWSESNVPDLINECLLDVLKEVEAKPKSLMGSLG